MLSNFFIPSLIALLVLAVLVEAVARKTRFPVSALLVLVGFLASELLVSHGIDTGIRAGNFGELIFYVFLPLLIFESAYRMDANSLFSNLGSILLLAIPGMLLTTAIVACGLYFGIGHPSGFPWIAALIAGAILASTDPVAIIEQLKSARAPKRLQTLMEGESLFNDASAIVLFGVLLAIAADTSTDFDTATIGHSILAFSWVFFGGIVIGIICGMAGILLSIVASQVHAKALASLVVAYSAFTLAEATLEVSGVMAVLAGGMMLGRYDRKNFSLASQKTITDLWQILAYAANSLVFLLAGVTVTLGMFEHRWLAILIGIAAALVARALTVSTCLSLVTLLGAEKTPLRQQLVITWGGLRGAVTLALALSLPTELPYWWTIQSIAFGVVIFTLFVQAPTNPILLKKL